MEPSNRRSGPTLGGSFLGGSVKGVLAGTIAVWMLDQVTWNMYREEDREAHDQEKEAQKEGKYVAQYAATRIARMAGRELTEREEWNYGQAIHYMLGVGPAVAYSVLRHQYPQITYGRGLAFGLGLFIANDEIAAPAMGLASGPTRYPLQAHVRGLVGHLIVGAVTDAVLGALDQLTAPAEFVSSTEAMDEDTDRQSGLAMAARSRRPAF